MTLKKYNIRCNDIIGKKDSKRTVYGYLKTWKKYPEYTFIISNDFTEYTISEYRSGSLIAHGDTYLIAVKKFHSLIDIYGFDKFKIAIEKFIKKHGIINKGE